MQRATSLLEQLRAQRLLGIAALALSLVVTATALYLYEAWWTISFLFVGLVVVVLERRRFGLARMIGIAGAVAGSILAGGMGVFLVVLSGGGDLFVLGVVLLVVAVVGLALSVRASQTAA